MIVSINNSFLNQPKDQKFNELKNYENSQIENNFNKNIQFYFKNNSNPNVSNYNFKQMDTTLNGIGIGNNNIKNLRGTLVTYQGNMNNNPIPVSLTIPNPNLIPIGNTGTVVDVAINNNKNNNEVYIIFKLDCNK